MATGQDQPRGRKNKVEKSHRGRKGRVAVGCREGAGPPGASPGMFPRGAARPWKLSLRGGGKGSTAGRVKARDAESPAPGAEGGGDPTGRRRGRAGRRLIPG